MSSRGPDWDFYQCKCGNILFEYNVVTGEKFMSETWSRCTATCMTPVTHVPTHTSPFPPMPIGPPKEKVSTGTETDEVLTDSCSCTSNTVNNESSHEANCCGEKVENSTSTNEEQSDNKDVDSAMSQASALDTTGSNGLHLEETLTKTTDLKPSASLPSDAILEVKVPVDETVCEKVTDREMETNGKTEDTEEVENTVHIGTHENENEKECEIEKMGNKEMDIKNENGEEVVEKQGSEKMEDESEKVENETKEKENEDKIEEEKELENETVKVKDNKTEKEETQAMEIETEKEKPENEETQEQESKILEVDSSNAKTAKDDDVTEKESTEIEKEEEKIEENETQEISDAKKEVEDNQDNHREESKPSEPSHEDESMEKTPERKTRSSTRNKTSKQTPTKPSPGKTLRKRKAETDNGERRTPVTRTQYPRRSPRLNVTKKRKTR